jgi:hypothetical protein
LLQLDVVQGSSADWVLAAINRDGSTPTGFLSSDTLTATVWQGQSQTALFSPTVSWNTYTSGLINLSVSSAQTSGLDQNGKYHLQISVTRSGVTSVVSDCLLKILASAGSGTQTTIPYCTLADMLLHANWVTMVQDEDADQESFYSQRLEATTWLNRLIVRSWRGTSAAYFGDSGRSAQFWLGSWVRRTPLSSYWLTNQLSGGIVQSQLTVTAAGSGYTFANVTFSGGGAPALGQATATATVSGGQVISLQLNSAGYSYTSAPTITITGNGSNATATCKISLHTLLLQPEVVRVCALKAASVIGLGQIGRRHNIAALGALFRDMASSEANCIVAELDLNGDGIADLPIPLNVTNTMFT